MEPATEHWSNDEKGPCLHATVGIGVTGHRKLNDERTLRRSVRKVIARLDGIPSHTPHTFVAVLPLAKGTDRLVAQEVLAWRAVGEAGKPRLSAVLPLPHVDYVQDFATDESKDEFETFLTRAMSLHILGEATSRTAVYEQAGHHVVQTCDVQVANWGGRPEMRQGGSAEIVRHARQVGRSLCWIHAGSGEVAEERHGD